jgi:hypothetical protein
VTIAEGGSLTGVNFTASAIASPTAPDIVGQWGAGFDVGTVAVNMVLLRTGKVLMFSGSYTFSAAERVWDPVTGTVTLVPNPYYNLFCAGQAQLPDGRILVAGGHDPSGLGAANANIFDPVSQSWSPLPNMAYRRWYPTVTALADGRMLVTSGAQSCLTCLADVPEIFNPATNKFSSMTSARLGIDYYPFMFVLPDGRLLSAGSNESAYETRTLNLSTGAWSMVDPVIKDGHSAVMYAPGKVLKTGTAADSGTAGNAASTAYVIDMNQASPTWRQVPSMKFARAFQNMTVLPDGNVLVTGGGTALDGYDVSKGVKTAELWSPSSETFTPLSDAAYARLYHSTALLLPDGRVLIAGSGDDGPAVNNLKAELYSPPYLFKGARPTITTAPDLIQYGSIFTVQTPDTASVASVSLIRPGSVTHGFDEDQRFVNLPFSRLNGNLAIQAPVNANIAPPGYYMLFIVNSAGVPSVASFVHFAVASSDTAAPSAPANLAAQAGLDTVSLTWTAATDNVAVSGYNVHRSTVAGFAPSTANRIGVTTATSYTDPGLAPGSYFYIVTAQDAAGNVGAPSAELAVFVSGDTTAPTVTISTPTDGSSATGTMQITATASDNVAVSGVQFQVDGAPLGAEVVTAPYAATWDSTAAADGPHTIAAVARDGAGNRSQSSITVTVSNALPEPEPDTTAPVVSLTSPQSQSTVGGTITVTASATDDVAVVGLLLQVDGTPIGAELTAAPYSLTWNTVPAGNGPHTLTAVARDAAGNTAQSSVDVTVFNDTTVPTVAFISPAGQAQLSGTVSLAVSASDDVAVIGVQFRLDGTSLGAELTAAPYVLSWNTKSAANGTHALAAIVRDEAGNTSQASIAVTVFNDTAAPAVGISSPANQSTVGGVVSIVAAASDNVAVVGLAFQLDGTPVGAELTSAPYSLTWNTALASNGAHALTAIARDAAGNTSMASVIVNVFNDTTAPSVTITSPANLSTVGGVVSITASAGDNVAVTGVQFQLDGVAAGPQDTAAPYATTWNTTAVANGPHTITAIARDAAGNIGAASVTITVFNDLLAPTVSVTSPADQSTLTGTVAVAASAGDNVAVAGVQFSLDGVALGAEDVSAPYSVNWDTTTATDGRHTLTVVARDGAGNNTQASVSVTVANGVVGLVAAYNFDEGGGTVVSDVSGNGNDGTIRRASYVGGRTGSALSFDGSSYVTILDNPSLDLTSGMTLEAWVRPTLTGNIRPVIYKERSVGFSYALLSANSNSGRPAGMIRTSADRTVTAPSAIPSSAWTHLALTYDGATVRLFVNGVQVSSTAASGPIAIGSGVLRLGAAPNGSDFFRGLIDDVRIYNRALSGVEIQADLATPVK